MTAAAPASTPQVGWLTTSTPGSRRISRPTMNFCRLPPERLAASGSRLALRTSNALVARSTGRQRRRRIDEAVIHHAVAAWPVSSAFSDSFMRGAVPWPSRSSGTKAAPSRAPPLIDQMAGGVAVDHHGAADLATPLAGQRGEQFVLAIAGDARDAENLAAFHFQRDVFQMHAMRFLQACRSTS